MFAHERQVNSMAARTFDDWWKNEWHCDEEAGFRSCWDAAIKSLEGVQTQPTNSDYVTALLFGIAAILDSVPDT